MNQVATIDQSEVNALLAELGGGADSEQDTIKIPFLKVQYEPEDKQDRPVPRGHFFLQGEDDPVYAKSVKVHVMAQYYQYREQNPDTYKIVNKTILLDDIRKNREARDMLGGFMCGRPDAKALKMLEPDEQKMWRKKVKATRILRGVTSYIGKTADGEEKVVENQPFQLYLTGSNFLTFDKVIEALPFGKKFQDVWADLDTRKEGKAFINQFAIDFSSPAVLTPEVVETMKVFVDMARQENSRIEQSFAKHQMQDANTSAVYDAISHDLDSDLED